MPNSNCVYCYITAHSKKLNQIISGIINQIKPIKNQPKNHQWIKAQTKHFGQPISEIKYVY